MTDVGIIIIKQTKLIGAKPSNVERQFRWVAVKVFIEMVSLQKASRFWFTCWNSGYIARKLISLTNVWMRQKYVLKF